MLQLIFFVDECKQNEVCAILLKNYDMHKCTRKFWTFKLWAQFCWYLLFSFKYKTSDTKTSKGQNIELFILSKKNHSLRKFSFLSNYFFDVCPSEIFKVDVLSANFMRKYCIMIFNSNTLTWYSFAKFLCSGWFPFLVVDCGSSSFHFPTTCKLPRR